jgi:hypothetical protein
MKYLYVLFSICFAVVCVHAQNPYSNNSNTVFDPTMMPVAVEADSSIKLIVSEYVLAKSVKRQMAAVKNVEKIEQVKRDSVTYLVFSINTYSKESVLIHVPLVKGRYGYYAGTNVVSCSNSCGNCTNCFCNGSTTKKCDDPPSNTNSIFPLSRVSTQIEVKQE